MKEEPQADIIIENNDNPNANLNFELNQTLTEKSLLTMLPSKFKNISNKSEANSLFKFQLNYKTAQQASFEENHYSNDLKEKANKLIL